jgi:hypothetical protein
MIFIYEKCSIDLCIAMGLKGKHLPIADNILTITFCRDEEDYMTPNMTDGIENTNMFKV